MHSLIYLISFFFILAKYFAWILKKKTCCLKIYTVLRIVKSIHSISFTVWSKSCIRKRYTNEFSKKAVNSNLHRKHIGNFLHCLSFLLELLFYTYTHTKEHTRTHTHTHRRAHKSGFRELLPSKLIKRKIFSVMSLDDSEPYVKLTYTCVCMF